MSANTRLFIYKSSECTDEFLINTPCVVCSQCLSTPNLDSKYCIQIEYLHFLHSHDPDELVTAINITDTGKKFLHLECFRLPIDVKSIDDLVSAIFRWRLLEDADAEAAKSIIRCNTSKPSPSIIRYLDEVTEDVSKPIILQRPYHLYPY